MSYFYNVGGGNSLNVSSNPFPNSSRVRGGGNGEKISQIAVNIFKQLPAMPTAIAQPPLPVPRIGLDAELRKRDTPTWACKRLVAGSDGLLSTVLRLRDEFNPAINPSKEKDASIKQFHDNSFPALEPGRGLIEGFVNRVEKAKVRLEKAREGNEAEELAEAEDEYNIADGIEKLGFKFEITPEGVFFTIPDAETINLRWKLLQQERPGLPDLDLTSEADDKDSLSFAKAYRDHTAYLTKGSEVAHDAEAHVIPVLEAMLSRHYRPQTRSHFQKHIADTVKVIEKGKANKAKLIDQFPKFEKIEKIIETGLGVYTDLTSANGLLGVREKNPLLDMGSYIQNTHGRGWAAAYDLGDVSFAEIDKVWKAMLSLG